MVGGSTDWDEVDDAGDHRVVSIIFGECAWLVSGEFLPETTGNDHFCYPSHHFFLLYSLPLCASTLFFNDDQWFVSDDRVLLYAEAEVEN